MRFFVDKTAHSPLMKFENGVLLIAGRSIPEDSISVYEPLFKFFDRYSGEMQKINIQIKLEYANSSTNRTLMEIFELMEGYRAQGKDISIDWHYVVNDKEMLDLGTDFKELVPLPFRLMEVESLD